MHTIIRITARTTSIYYTMILYFNTTDRVRTVLQYLYIVAAYILFWNSVGTTMQLRVLICLQAVGKVGNKIFYFPGKAVARSCHMIGQSLDFHQR